MRLHTPSLRALVGALVLLVTVLAIVVSAALVLLTTVLHRATTTATAAVESVRLAEEAEIDLLLHERAKDPVVRRNIEADLRRRLDGARRFVSTEQERRILADAESNVDAYFAISRDSKVESTELARHQEDAYGALEALVNVNIAQARDTYEGAARWDQVANVVGFGVGALVLIVAGGILTWLKLRAFAPVLSLATAMERFGKGEWDARAPEKGASELREMSRRFNEMASAIAAQRQLQVAFLGSVAHDIKNPLSVLASSVAMVRPGEPLPPEPSLRQMIQRIERQITRLDRMASDFMDLAKIEARELELKVEAHDARTIVRDVVALFEGITSERRIDVSIPHEPIPVYCDQLRIEQVVTNLISNALKYSPQDTSIAVAVEPYEAEVGFAVTDHGVGISEHDRERVFEPFRRVGLSRETVPGVGLGLFVVRRIVEAHSGRIDVESTPGVGSTFRVLLPRRPVASVVAPHEGPPP